MKYILILIISIHSISTVCNAQVNLKQKHNSLALEFGKAGLIFNLAFDHQFKAKNYGFRLDIGSNLLKYQQVFQTGGGFYYLSGNKNNSLELGIDLRYFEYTLSSDDQKDLILLFIDKPTRTYYTNLNVGYRYCGRQSMFRFGLSPGVMNTGFVLGGYISIGCRF